MNNVNQMMDKKNEIYDGNVNRLIIDQWSQLS